MLCGEPGKGWDTEASPEMGPQTNPNKGPTRARCAAGQWPGLVCGTAAPAVVIREYQALGEVDNLNVNICLLI